MKKEELLAEFEKEFEKIRSEFNLVQTLDDFDSIFFFKDFILREGYVSENLSRALSHRIVNTYQSWLSHMHSIILPSPGSMFALKETELFSQEDKEEINKLIQQIMALISVNVFIGLSKDKAKEAEFFRDSIDFWNKTFLPIMLKATRKINEGWNRIAQEDGEKKKQQLRNSSII